MAGTQVSALVGLLLLFCTLVVSKKMFMPGEPLSPSIFEKADQLVEKPFDFSKTDDGTTNDIITPRQTTRGGGVKQPWPNGIVPYMLDNGFTEQDRIIIAKAITIFKNLTCVRVIARTTEPNYVLVHKTSGSACGSIVGFQGGKQTVNLAERCIKNSGSTVHEFMHTIGFLHEQTRSDRDEFITVHFDNIMKRFRGQFEKSSGIYANDPEQGAYDPHSITHYSRNADAIDRSKDTMTPKDPSITTLGQRKNLTELDIQKINEFYKCSGNVAGVGTATGADNGVDFNSLVPKPPMMPGGMQPPPPSTGSTRSSVPNLISVNETGADDGAAKNKSALINIIFKCEDYDKEMCQSLVQHKYCTVNPMFMNVFCRRACKKCGMGCVDMNPLCETWGGKGYCAKFSDYMHHFCPKACGRCYM